MRFSEEFGIVFGVKPANNQAGFDTDSINLGKGHNLIFLIASGAITSDAVLKLYSGATDGTKTTAETFNYRLADADQGSDLADNFADWATSAALTLTAATYDLRLLLVEIAADELTDGQEWVTLEFSSGASTLFNCVIALVRPRYAGHDVPTVLA